MFNPSDSPSLVFANFYQLRYVWGEVILTKELVCNGIRHNLATPNLVTALQRLRYPTKSRLLWTDAVCINQSSEIDKGHQVRQMQEIYQRADRVLVFLGEDDEDEAHHAFALLCAIVNGSGLAKTKAIFRTIDERYQGYSIEAKPPLKDEIWIDLRALFISQWFMRMWVIQGTYGT